jgi:FkbM family methyltransferase
VPQVKEAVSNFAWRAGIRAFRLTRKVNLSTRLEPAFWRLGQFVPSTKGELQASLPFGMTLRMPPGYRDARTVAVGLFQHDETRLFERLAHPGMTVVDVGAYAGYFTLLGARLVGASGRVVAFEPEPEAFQYLLGNVEANDCRNVVAVRKAVSDGASTATLMRDPVGPESFLTNSTDPGQGVLVETISLDEYFEEQNWPAVHLIKMNIEGWELPALKGMRELSKRNPALQLIIEFNPMAMTRGGISREELGRTLAELGFRRGQIVERGLKVVPAPELLPTGSAVYNIFLTK